MIKEHQKFQLPDQGKKNTIKAEVNWNPNDTRTNESQVIKLTLPNGEQSFIKREHLNEILFAIGSAEDQMKLIPQKLQTVHWRKTVLGVKATKSIEKGEMVNFPIEISFPCTNIKEVIGTGKLEKDQKQKSLKDKWSSPG